MFEKLLIFIFNIIEWLADKILTPLYTLLSSIIPGFSEFISSLGNIFTIGIDGAVALIKLFCIPIPAISIFFVFVVAYGVIAIGIRIIKLVYNIYHKLKPT